MGALVRLMLRLLGYEIKLPTYLSPVSKTIEMIPTPKKTKWIWGGILHFVPVLIGLCIIFFVRGNQIQHGSEEEIALWFAGLWSLVGPNLIWYYEKYTLPIFYKNCRQLVKGTSYRDNIKKLVFSNIHSIYLCNVISISWIVIVIISFLFSMGFVKKFGITGFNDFIWWLLFLGVLIYAYYTSLGFCFTYKTILITKMVNVSNLENRVYHRDAVFGFSFIGDFALRTSLMFLSGWLIAPLIYLISQHGSFYEDLITLSLLGSYISFILFSFIFPINIIHKKIVNEKELLSRRYCGVINDLVDKIDNEFKNSDYCKFSFYRKIIIDLHALGEWPLKLDVGIRFAFSNIIFPLLVGISVIILSA